MIGGGAGYGNILGSLSLFKGVSEVGVDFELFIARGMEVETLYGLGSMPDH